MPKNDYKNEIRKKIASKKAIIGVIGLGYAGLPLALLFAKKNFCVNGFDIDKDKIKKIKKGQSYINRIKDEQIKILNKKGSFSTTFENINKCDFIIICVPTPLKKNDEPDLKFVKKSFSSIKNRLREGQTIVLESTSYPGTTKEIIIDQLKNNFSIGKEIYVGFSSERINPGFNENTISEVPKVVSGYTKNCLDIISMYYSSVFTKIIKSNKIEVAEFSKLLENIYRSVNIGFINEMKFVADKMNIDIFEIIKIASTKPFGFRPFHPGPGIGGHCIPIDPNYLSWKAKKIGISTSFIKLSSKINLKVLSFLKSKIFQVLKEKKIKINKAKILILGVAYKRDIDDYRESASIKLLNTLIKKNVRVSFSDPYVKILETGNKAKKLKGIRLNSQKIKNFDLVVLMTDHEKFNYEMIYKNSKLIIDCRGRYNLNQKVIRA
jgi:UDP-N-acetyl-D-glucosamine dehydrogenase